jgi:hypothetical protein
MAQRTIRNVHQPALKVRFDSRDVYAPFYQEIIVVREELPAQSRPSAIFDDWHIGTIISSGAYSRFGYGPPNNFIAIQAR